MSKYKFFIIMFALLLGVFSYNTYIRYSLERELDNFNSKPQNLKINDFENEPIPEKELKERAANFFNKEKRKIWKIREKRSMFR